MNTSLHEHITLEACVETIQEALSAQGKGADRIELCGDLSVGGVTPSYGLIAEIKKRLRIPMMVMIRPRGGDFMYDDMEIEIMKTDIQACKELGVQGVVFGLLTKEGRIDLEKTKILANLAKPLQVTFHKAIDDTPDLIEAIRQLSAIPGIQRVLTSGGTATALEGKEVLNEMIRTANDKLTILAAGKVTHENLEHIKRSIPTTEFHGRKIVGNL